MLVFYPVVDSQLSAAVNQGLEWIDCMIKPIKLKSRKLDQRLLKDKSAYHRGLKSAYHIVANSTMGYYYIFDHFWGATISDVILTEMY